MAVEKMETAEHRVGEAPAGTFVIAAVLIFAAMIAIAYRTARGYRRWRRANHPFAGSFARVERVGTTYRDRRANLGEVVRFIGEIIRMLKPG